MQQREHHETEPRREKKRALGDFQRGGMSNITRKVTSEQDVHREANGRRDSELS